MVTTTTAYTDSRNRANPGLGYDGVVYVSFGGYYGTGALLYDGRAILTAAHLFDGRTGTASVTFETASGTQTVSAGTILSDPAYDANGNDDLAIVWLSEAPPLAADRYDLYRHSDEIGEVFTMVGFGSTGTGAAGSDPESDPIRLKADNTFEADGADIKSQIGSSMPWSPSAGLQLIADFDKGSTANDALGQLMDCNDLGLGLDEGLIAPGDSGGPAFLDGKIAGVASYTATLANALAHPDIDSLVNSSFGELAAWQRVSAQQQWIDQSLRAHYRNAPTCPEEVQSQVNEGYSGTTHAYFLLQFTGVRSDPDQLLSVDYATRNGTAIAGSDYIAASGTLNLYPDENQAVIPVEIIGDTTPEPNETFCLDVFNPVGGCFGEGLVKLTAVRTIVNDDIWFG